MISARGAPFLRGQAGIGNRRPRGQWRSAKGDARLTLPLCFVILTVAVRLPAAQQILEVLGVRAQLTAALVVALLVVTVPACLAQGWDGSGTLWDARTVRMMPTQSWFGGTGMVVIPTAEIIPQTRVSAHFHAIDVETKDDWEDVWGITASIYPGIEAGITHLGEAFTGTGSDELVYQAKYRIDNIDELCLDMVPFVEEDAVDFGRFLYEVFVDTDRRSRIWS